MGRRRHHSHRTDAASKPRGDGWVNLVSGLGDETKDRRLAASFRAQRLTHTQLEEIWRGDDMAARIIEALPGDMTRKWIEVQTGDDKDVAVAMTNRLDELEARTAFKTALEWARGFGGSGILVGANDGQAVDQPLNLDTIRSVDFLTVLDCQELVPLRYYGDPSQPKYGKPETYRIQPSVGTGSAMLGSTVHETRIIRFDGVVVSRRQLQENNGWGDPVMTRVFNVIRDFQAAWDGTAYLLTDFSQAVFKIKELQKLIAANKEGVVQARLRMLEIARSLVRAVVVDADGESFERQTTSVAGLSDLLQQFALRLSAAARMPVSKLLGQAPAGLNATGASDIRFWYDQVAAEQEAELRKPLNRLLTILFRAKGGPTNGVEPEAWSIKFKPLWQLDELQQADLRLKTAQTDEINIRNNIVRPEEVAVSRFGGDEYSTSTTIDRETREEMEQPDNPEAVEAEKEAAEAVKPSTDPEVAVDPNTALNGAQVASMVDVVKAVAAGELPRETGVAILEVSFPITAEQANKIMGEVGKGFTPKSEQSGPVPPQFARFTGQQPADPEAKDEEP